MAAETPQMKLARESAERGQELEPTPGFAVISCSASELIPTRQYANVTVGPITVKRVVRDDENLASEIQKTQILCEAAVAEERQTVHVLTRERASS